MKLFKTLLFAVILRSTFIATGYSQEVGIKTNLLYWATTTPNISVETALGLKTTLDVQGSYNPFYLSNRQKNKKLQHWMVQPELRLWTCEKFLGGFFGFHGFYGRYNAGGIDLPLDIFPSLKDHRYEGWFTGAGVSYGYQWFLGDHWNLEAQFGFGYAYVDYKKYECHRCGAFIEKGHKHYIGPTKIAVSFVYLFKSRK